MTDMDAFQVGENIGVTPGKVVYPERPDAADPVRADHRAGAEAAAADHPALDQQVLHPRPAAARTPSSAGRSSQGHTVFVISWVNPDEQLAEKTFEDYMQRRLARRAGRDRAGDRRARGQRHRLLPRRHAAGLHAGLHGGEEGRPHQERDLLRHHDRLPGGRRAGRLHRRGAAADAGRADEQARLSGGRRKWRPPSTCCAPTT